MQRFEDKFVTNFQVEEKTVQLYVYTSMRKIIVVENILIRLTEQCMVKLGYLIAKTS